MLVLAIGDLHGRIRAMVSAAEEWSRREGRMPDAILQVGDLGVFPDTSRLSPEKVRKYGVGDYAELAAGGWSCPIPTYFCKGNNEDFSVLHSPLIPGLHLVDDGKVITLGGSRIAFLGGGWAPKSYASEEGKPNHISRLAVQRLFAEEFDILVSHEAPAGTRFPGSRYAVGAPPIRDLILAKQPALVVHGHHHRRADHSIGSTRVISLGLLDPSNPEPAIFPLEL